MVPSSQPQDSAGQSDKLSDQLALPTPPQPIKTNGVTNQREQIFDLLSDTFVGDRSPQTPATPPIVGSNRQLALAPIPQQPDTGNLFASNTFQQQQGYPNGSMFQQQPAYPNGSMFNSLPFLSQQGYQTPQQYSPYSGQQYQNHPYNQGQVAQNNYVVPWAMGFKQPPSPQQNAVAYGSGSHNLQSESVPLSSSYPPPPWIASSSEPIPHSINLQQRAMLYGNNTFPTQPSTFQYSPRTTPFLQQHRSFNSFSYRPTSGEVQRDFIQKTQNLSLHDGLTRQASSTISQPSPPKPFTPADRLFEDLIDLRSTNPNLKTSGVSHSLSGASSSKEGTR